MNNAIKVAVAGALALGAANAFAIGVPSSNSSDLILYVDAVSSTGSSAGVYASDTGITLNSLMPAPYTAGAANSLQYPGTSAMIQPSATLTSFINSHAGDTFGWTVEGGQYNNTGFANGSPTAANNNNSVAPGSALAVFSSPALTLAFPKVSTASTVALQDFLNGLNNDIQSGGISGLMTGSETTGTETLGAPNKYGFVGASDLATGTSAVKLFGFTGNGVNNGTLQSYLLGTASFSATGLLEIDPNGSTVTPPPPTVPLPAAVWLLGSGLMGLAGVSRRRKAAAGEAAIA